MTFDSKGTLKPGDRVVCVRDVTDTRMNVFGHGTYLGPFRTPNGPDVKIRLDDGQEILGSESPIWLFESDMNDDEIKDLKVEVVSLANDRAMKQKVHAVCVRIGNEIAAKVPGLKIETCALVRANPHEATVVASFAYERAMTTQEIAEIDALVIGRFDNKRKPS